MAAAKNGLNKPQKLQLEDMASEMEKLRRENEELKSHLRSIRKSNSQSCFRGHGTAMESASLVKLRQEVTTNS